MRKALVAIVLGLLITAALAEMFPDVPKDHWAYVYVKNLYEKGIVIGYPDATFKGEQYATRYELAAVIARMYDAIEARLLDVIQGKFDSMNIQDLAKKVSELEKKVSQIESTKAEGGCAGCEYIPNILETVNSLSIKVQLHDEQIAYLLSRVGKGGEAEGGDVYKRLESLEKEIENIKEKLSLVKLDKYGAKLYELEKIVSVLKKFNLNNDYTEEILKMLNDHEIRLQVIEDSLIDLKATLKKAKEEVKNETIGEVKGEVQRIATKVEAIKGETSKIEEKVNNLKKNVDNLEMNVAKKVSSQIKGDLSAIKSTVNDLAKEVKFVNAKNISKLNTQVARLWSKVIEIESKLKYVKGKEGADEYLSSVNIQLMKIYSKIKELEKKTSKIDGNSAKIEDLKAEIEALRTDLNGVVSTLFEVARMSTLQKDEFEDMISELKNYDKSQDEDIYNLYELVMKLEGKVKSLEKSNSKKFESLEKSLASYSKDINSLKTNMKIVNSDIIRLYKIAGDLQKKVLEYDSKLKDMQQNIDNFQMSIGVMYDEIDETKSQMETLREGLFAMRDDFGSEIKSIEERLDNLEESVKSLEAVNSSQDRDIFRLYSKVDSLEKKFSEAANIDKAQDTDIAKLYDLANDLYKEVYAIKEKVSKIDRMESSIFGNAKLLKFIYEKLDKDEDVIRSNSKAIEKLNEKLSSIDEVSKKVEENAKKIDEVSKKAEENSKKIGEVSKKTDNANTLAIIGIVLALVAGGIAIYAVTK